MAENFEKVAAEADAFGNWDARLKLEIPFFSALLRKHGAQHLCDAGCGAGRHTVAFAQMGFAMTGADPNFEYIQSARQRAEESGASIAFHTRGFDAAAQLPERPFDAVLVLGNALSLIESPEKLSRVLAGFARALKPRGLLLIQVPNYHLYDDPLSRWKTLSAESGGAPRLVLKHFAPWGEWHFAVEFLTIQFDQAAGWRQELRHTRVLNLTAERLDSVLAQRFEVIERFGHADGRVFSPMAPDCISLARKSG